MGRGLQSYRGSGIPTLSGVCLCDISILGVAISFQLKQFYQLMKMRKFWPISQFGDFFAEAADVLAQQVSVTEAADVLAL